MCKYVVDNALCITVAECELERFQTAKVTLKVTDNCAIYDLLLVFHCNYVSIYLAPFPKYHIFQNFNKRSRDPDHAHYGVLCHA